MTDSGSPSADDLARARLLAAVRERGFPEGAGETLLRYLDALLAENAKINLTGAKSPADAIPVLVLDAISLGSDPKLIPSGIAIDLGTGNGFPGVVVAVAWPACRVVLVERREKKARAVERCLAAAGIRNCRVVACDGRELLKHRPDLRRAADLVTVRAVGDLAPVTKEAAPWLAPGGRIVHWKPFAVSPEERRLGDEAARRAGLVPAPDVEFAPDGGPPSRRLVVYERPR